MSLVKIVTPTAAKIALSGATRVVPVDATWYMPNSPHNAKEKFVQESRIANLVFFDLDGVCDPNSKYPHMLPSQKLFNLSVGKLGIGKSDTVLVYDRQGVFSGPRAAWTFSLFGHENVLLLDNYEQYKQKYAVNEGSDTTEPTPTLYGGIDAGLCELNLAKQTIDYHELRRLVKQGAIGPDYLLFDARSADRFSGVAPEPRPGLSSGHVPGAISLPFGKVLNDQGHYKEKEELREMFKKDYALDLELVGKNLIVMCGTGVTAVILKLALERAGAKGHIRVYDGSWTEWAQRAEDLIAKDSA